MENETVLLDENEPKKRHGCITAWLILMIVTNSIATVIYFFARDLVERGLHNGDVSMLLILLGFLGIANIVFAILLFKWKKMGFYGYIGTSIVVLLINFQLGIGIGRALIGLLGVAVLFAILQIKEGGVKAWDHLE